MVSRLQCQLFMKLSELESAPLVERIALAIGDCLGVGALSRTTGAVTTYFPCTEHWAAVLSKAQAGTGWAFPGVRLAAVAGLINRMSAGVQNETELERISFAAQGSRIVFQRCPWNLGEVLFVVLPDAPSAKVNFEQLRQVLEAVRRDVGIVCGSRAGAFELN